MSRDVNILRHPRNGVGRDGASLRRIKKILDKESALC